MKYEWIEYGDISNQEELNRKLDEILSLFGEKYTINFNENCVDYS